MTAARTRTKPGAKLHAAGLRFYEVQDDKMDPTIRKRDFVLIAPVDRWIGDGYYLISNGLGETIYSCDGFGGTREKPEISMIPHNKAYLRLGMPRAEFEERVLAKVVMIGHVVAHHLLPSLRGDR